MSSPSARFDFGREAVLRAHLKVAMSSSRSPPPCQTERTRVGSSSSCTAMRGARWSWTPSTVLSVQPPSTLRLMSGERTDPSDGIVWAPVAAYFLLSGAIWQGVVLGLFGVFVIGLVDNVLRPILVGKDTKMPDYLILISTLGGLSVFGLNGFVIGPLVAALFMSSWALFVESKPRLKLPLP